MKQLNQVLAAGVLMTMLTAGCSENPSGSSTDTSTLAPVVFEGAGYKILEEGVSHKAGLDLNAHKMTETVCDPFGGAGAPKLKNGITAQLFWLDNVCPRYDQVEALISHAHTSDKKLFFTDLFTPTRLFTKGFSTQTTDTLKDDQGNLLIEWFGLKFKSGLRLPAGLDDGEYELAMLSDDGTILRVKSGADWSTLVNNDGVHPTRMGCSSSFVSLSKTGVLDFELFYAQGPRYHISNVMLWRHKSKTSGQAGKDTACGDSGNNLFFNPDKNSEPQAAYRNLLARGWNPVPADAFVIPDNDYNPCFEGVPPVVSDFRVIEITLTDAIMSWTTDLPATTQLRWTNTVTGEVRVSDSDNRLRTAHSMWLTGLTPDTTYSVEVLTTSKTNKHTITKPFTIHTKIRI
jgi:hypothetical protein